MSGQRKKWDLTSNNSLVAATKWIGRDSKAVIVVAIRQTDGAIYADDNMTPEEVIETLRLALPKLHGVLIDLRKEKAEEEYRKAWG